MFGCLEAKLKEYPVQEKKVLKILTQVNVTRRQCEIVRLANSVITTCFEDHVIQGFKKIFIIYMIIFL